MSSAFKQNNRSPGMFVGGAGKQKLILAKLARARGAGSFAPVRTGGFLGGTATIRPETKCVDHTMLDAGTVSSSVSIVQAPLNGVATGASFYQRIGRTVHNKYVQIKFDLRPATTTTSDAIARAALVWDNQTNGVAPTYSDIFQDVDFSGGANSNTLSGINLNNRERFRILRDELFTVPGLSDTQTTAGGNQPTTSDNRVVRNWFVPLKDAITVFGGDTAGIGDIKSGSLIFLVSTVGNAAPNGHVLRSAWRWRFRD